jgi:hypothetical protein
VVLIREKAERMAREWAGLEMARQDQVAREPDEDDLPF